jgi:hypothetical protein
MNSGSSEDSKACAVSGCTLPISDVGHLCDSHRLPGMVARVNNRNFVITAWAANSPWRNWRIFCKADDVAEYAIPRSTWQGTRRSGFRRADSG